MLSTLVSIYHWSHQWQPTACSSYCPNKENFPALTTWKIRMWNLYHLIRPSPTVFQSWLQLLHAYWKGNLVDEPKSKITIATVLMRIDDEQGNGGTRIRLTSSGRHKRLEQLRTPPTPSPSMASPATCTIAPVKVRHPLKIIWLMNKHFTKEHYNSIV